MLKNIAVAVFLLLASLVQFSSAGEKNYLEMNYQERAEFLRQRNIRFGRELFDPKQGETPQVWENLRVLFNEDDNHSLIRHKICKLTGRISEMGYIVSLIEGADTRPEDRIIWSEIGHSRTAGKSFYRKTGVELAKTLFEFVNLPVKVREYAKTCDLGKASFSLREGTQITDDLMSVLETVNARPEDIGTTRDMLRRIAHREFHASMSKMRQLLAQKSPRKGLTVSNWAKKEYGEEVFILECVNSIIHNVYWWGFSDKEKALTSQERNGLVQLAPGQKGCGWIKMWSPFE